MTNESMKKNLEGTTQENEVIVFDRIVMGSSSQTLDGRTMLMSYSIVGYEVRGDRVYRSNIADVFVGKRSGLKIPIILAVHDGRADLPLDRVFTFEGACDIAYSYAKDLREDMEFDNLSNRLLTRDRVPDNNERGKTEGDSEYQ